MNHPAEGLETTPEELLAEYGAHQARCEEHRAKADEEFNACNELLRRAADAAATRLARELGLERQHVELRLFGRGDHDELPFE